MTISYYLLGSKYEESKNYWVDMFPEMLERGVVSVGWERERSLNRYYGKPYKQIKVLYVEGPICRTFGIPSPQPYLKF